MDQQNAEMIASALFGDNSTMLSAVASLLSRHQGNKELDASLTAPLLVLTSMPGKDSLLANVVLGTAQSKNGGSKSEPSYPAESIMPSLEQVHALATANLVASTQRDIAKQLAEASTSSYQASSLKASDSKGKTLEQREAPKKGKAEHLKRVDKKKLSPKVTTEQPKTVTPESKSTPSEPKALVCTYEGCNRKFAWLNHLKYHELTHTNNRQFKCTEESCGKTFFTAQRLSVHQRIHTGEKPFKCTHQDCGKTFTTAGNLKNHQRIHTGEQPFVCDHVNCNRRFTEQSSLRKHKLTHSGDKPFECKLCGKKFTQSGSRRQHLIRHHLDDEIRESFKQESIEKDGEEDEQLAEEDKGMSSNGLSCSNALHTESSAIKAVSCSPQVLVLNNAYPGLPTSESIVFSHGLSDHIVTVKTQSMDQSITDSDSLSLSHTLLNSDVSTGLHDGALHSKTDDLVVLSEASMYQHEENHGDIVYAADILDHEEVAHADYVSSHVDYSGEITQDGEVSSHDDYGNHQELSHSETYTPEGDDITVSAYAPAECIHVTSYSDSKDMSQTYLDSERDITHSDFIGAEEVAVAQYPCIPSNSDLAPVEKIATECSDTSGPSVDTVTEHFCHTRQQLSPDKQDTEESTLMEHPPCHAGLAYIPSSTSSERDHSVVTSHSSHTLGRGAVDREMHMDPMMECDDEEPEKQQMSTVS